MTDLPDTFVHTHADLEAFWRARMEPLGFARRALWIAFLAADDRVSSQLVEIGDLPCLPEPAECDGLVRLVDHLREKLDVRRFALLLARPGRDDARHDDRAWASALRAAAWEAGVCCELVHLATDARLVPIPLDDLDPAAIR